MAFSGKKCPVDPAHGNVIAWTGHPRWGWRCPHQDHDGRPHGHPLGPAPVTRSFFTTAEVDAGHLEDA